MHEYMLVEGIISSVMELAAGESKRILSFKVIIGELAQYDVNLVEYLIDELARETVLDSVDVEVEKAVVKCIYCGREWMFDELVSKLSDDEKEMIHFLPDLISSFVNCPSCGGMGFEVESGRDVKICEVRLVDY